MSGSMVASMSGRQRIIAQSGSFSQSSFSRGRATSLSVAQLRSPAFRAVATRIPGIAGSGTKGDDLHPERQVCLWRNDRHNRHNAVAELDNVVLILVDVDYRTYSKQLLPYQTSIE